MDYGIEQYLQPQEPYHVEPPYRPGYGPAPDLPPHLQGQKDVPVPMRLPEPVVSAPPKPPAATKSNIAQTKAEFRDKGLDYEAIAQEAAKHAGVMPTQYRKLTAKDQWKILMNFGLRTMAAAKPGVPGGVALAEGALGAQGDEEHMQDRLRQEDERDMQLQRDADNRGVAAGERAVRHAQMGRNDQMAQIRMGLLKQQAQRAARGSPYRFTNQSGVLMEQDGVGEQANPVTNQYGAPERPLQPKQQMSPADMPKLRAKLYGQLSTSLMPVVGDKRWADLTKGQQDELLDAQTTVQLQRQMDAQRPPVQAVGANGEQLQYEPSIGDYVYDDGQ